MGDNTNNIPIVAWKWLYENKNNLRFSRNSAVSTYLNTFVQHGLLLFKKGRFVLTDALRGVLSDIQEEEKRMRLGVPMEDRQTCADSRQFAQELWYRGRTPERKWFLTNFELVLFRRDLGGFTVIDSPNLLEVEVVISQVKRAIFREDYIDLEPTFFQRASYFAPGVVVLTGSPCYSISIDESYYDLLMSFKEAPLHAFKAVDVGKDLVVVTNPILSTRYTEDIMAVVGSCGLEGVAPCVA